MKQSVVMSLVGATIIGSIGSMGVSSALTDSITLIVDGQAAIVRAAAGTVAGLLSNQKVDLGPHDSVSPALSAPLSDGLVITVTYAHQVDLTVDGYTDSVWTTGETVAGVLADLDLLGSTATVSPSPDTPVTADGLAITVQTPKLVTLVIDGATTTFETPLLTVAALLDARGVTLAADDRVMPPLDTPLNDGDEIAIQRVQTTTETATVEVPYQTVHKNSSKITAGKTKVQTAGVNGTNTQTWQIVTVDGVEESRTLVDEVVDVAPVDEVILDGTKQPTPPPAPAADTNATTTTTPAPKATGGTSTNPNSGDTPSGWSTKFMKTQSQALVAQIRAANPGNAVVQLAADQVGKRYVHGAEGPNSFDCSGLVWYIYKTLYGRTLPRTAGGQGHAATPVAWSDIRPGDILWVNSHVAIYVGNGLIIHAENSRSGVTIGNAGFLKATGYHAARL